MQYESQHRGKKNDTKPEYRGDNGKKPMRGAQRAESDGENDAAHLNSDITSGALQGHLG